MAISVERAPHRAPARAGRVERYGARLVALAAYASALVLGIVLLAPAFTEAGPATASALPAAQPRMATVDPGATLELVAAENGLSVARLLALNPGLGPFSLASRKQVRVG